MHKMMVFRDVKFYEGELYSHQKIYVVDVCNGESSPSL